MAQKGGRARHPPGCPGWPPEAPLRLYDPLGVETPEEEVDFAETLLFRRRRRFQIGVAEEAAPAPCRREITPPGDHP